LDFKWSAGGVQRRKPEGSKAGKKVCILNEYKNAIKKLHCII
jgi:hypothetical protein